MKRIVDHHSPYWLAALLLTVGRATDVEANPAGLSVGSGSASLQQIGAQLNINVSSAAAVLNWQSFNIGAGETTRFLQPSQNSVALNLIGGASPSQIFGNLTANGTVILANGNGFYFGPNSFVSVGGSFIATTAPQPQDLGSGAGWQFTGMPPLASIVNYGQINVGAGKSLYLIAENIENQGGLSAPGGSVDLAAGQEVLVSETPDGRGLSATVKLPAGSVDNFGRVTADGGSIAVQAQVINQNGILQADSIKNQNGVIELVAADTVNLGPDSQILARGDASSGGSAGGDVIIKSDNIFSDTAGSQIVTTGGAQGGNGGNVEVSAPNILTLASSMDGSAVGGSTAGQLLLDPINITLTGSGTTTTAANPNGGGTVNGSASTTANWTVNVNTAFLNKNFSQITLEASGNISLSSGLNWNLSASTGETAGNLTLLAGQNIVFGSNAKITDANDWSVSLQAGYNFKSGSVTSGTGNIYLNGSNAGTVNGTIQTAAGDINLWAGQSIQLGAGSVFTTGGGNIFAWALNGDVNTGLWPVKQANADYTFGNNGAVPNATVLGGFSTGAGGNVTLIASDSVSPAQNLSTGSPSANGSWPAESGAYGAGDVTVIANHQISGNFLLANGTGTLLAGATVTGATPGNIASQLGMLTSTLETTANASANIGQSSQPVILSLIAGTWNAFAANDIFLNEVNNPNGTFNVKQAFQFNYAPTAAANLWAGDAITLGGNAPRTSANASMESLYPPVLSLNAGAGGITVDSSLILYPSSAGSLAIATRNGGSLSAAAGTEITMSDSAYNYYGSDNNSGTYNDFTFAASTYASVPLLLNNSAGPVKINVTGDWTGLGLNLPEAAQINVLGNISDASLQAWNLHSADATTINAGAAAKQAMENSGVLSAATDGNLAVGGNINLNGSQLKVSGPGSFNINANTVEMDASASIIAGETVTPATSVILPVTLTADAFKAALSSTPDLAAKLQYDATTGRLTYAGAISPAEATALLAALGTAESAAIQQLYTENQKDILGANLNLTTAGNLTMTMTTAIVNYGLFGNVSLNIGDSTGGTVTIGNDASDAATQTQPTAGIFTSSGGDVSVISGGSISVGQSRIATYDGGNITVLSLQGNIDCGVGSLGVTYVNNAYELDPATGQLVDLLAGLGSNLGNGLGFGIPGSGIRANTFVNGNAKLGNMLIEAPHGYDITLPDGTVVPAGINASEGGIVALHFNSLEISQAANAVMDVFAGYELENLAGQPLTAADLTAGQTFKNITLTPTPADPYKYANLLDAAGAAIGQLVRVTEKQDITATGSGIIGQIINAQATGEISGLLSGREVSVTAPQIGSLVVFSHDTPVISGTSLNGADPVIVSPTVDTAAPAAAAAVADAPTADTAATVTAKTQLAGDGTDDEEAKKRGKGKGIGLAQKVSRVTVLLPAKY